MGESFSSTPRKRRAWPLYALVAVCAAPAVAAWIVYSVPGLLPEARGNRGMLVQPAVPLPATIGDERFRGRWSMLTWAGDDCGDSCRSRVMDMRQIRLALAEHRDRTGRFVFAAADAEGLSGLEDDWPGTQLLSPSAQVLGELGMALDAAGVEPREGSVYLVDPMGDLMMAYGPGAPAEDILADLEVLFQASKNWIDGVEDGNW